MNTLQGNALYKKYQKLKFNYNDFVQFMYDDDFANNWKGFSVQQAKFQEYQQITEYHSLKDNSLLRPQFSNISPLLNNFHFFAKELISTCNSGDFLVLRDRNKKKWIYDWKNTNELNEKFIRFFKK